MTKDLVGQTTWADVLASLSIINGDATVVNHGKNKKIRIDCARMSNNAQMVLFYQLNQLGFKKPNFMSTQDCEIRIIFLSPFCLLISIIGFVINNV